MGKVRGANIWKRFANVIAKLARRIKSRSWMSSAPIAAITVKIKYAIRLLSLRPRLRGKSPARSQSIFRGIAGAARIWFATDLSCPVFTRAC